jgi:hypothetical protein
MYYAGTIFTMKMNSNDKIVSGDIVLNDIESIIGNGLHLKL